MDQIDIESNEYPQLLKRINDPPKTLFYRGVWDTDIFTETLGVVGSRKMTTYGETITNRLVGDISDKGITIISGFMYGIDAEAHAAALNVGGRTVAVMPCGINLIHPEYQSDLYFNIIENRGLIISEYPDSTPPALWTYPRRNRIVAALSQVLLVIEAGVKSGALITSGIAKKYNKKIYAVPGPLTSSVSIGTALLIKNGASIVTEAGDILEYYGKRDNLELFSKRERYGLNKNQNKIIDLLNNEALEIDQIIRQLKKPTATIGSDLTLLSIRKLIINKNGKYYLMKGV